MKTYVYYADPLMGILSAAAFSVGIMYHQTKQKSMGQLVLGRDTILPIDYIANLR